MEFSSWIKNIILCSISLIIFEMLIPKTKFKKTVEGVLGLVLTFVILMWPLSLLKQDMVMEIPDYTVQFDVESMKMTQLEQIKLVCEQSINEDIKDIMIEYEIGDYDVEIILDNSNFSVDKVYITINNYVDLPMGLKEKIALKTGIDIRRLFILRR